MSREDPQMKLRMSEELRDRLKAEAEANKRSMNAEIVARLEASLTPPFTPPPEPPAEPPSDKNTLYILLDTDGMPISWNEATMHLSEIARAGKLRFHSQQARIYASEHVSSSEREDEWYALLLKYRELHGRNIPENERAWLAEFRRRDDSKGAT